MNDQLSRIVDQLGQTRASIAELRVSEALLEGILKNQGQGKYEGQYFSASVSEYERTNVAWKEVALKLKPSVQLLTAHTNYTPVVRIEVNARSTEKVPA
jgi:hypothetical protein